MSRYVLVKMFKVTDYTFMDERDGASEVWELFQLNDEGQWVQEYMPPLVYLEPKNDEHAEHNKLYDNKYDLSLHMELTTIKGFEGGHGERLLQHLNEQTTKQQLENGVHESDIAKGVVILNSIGEILVK